MSNEVYKMNNDNEGYTFSSDIERFIDETKISREMTIWCPFDKEDSNFVKVLKDRGYKVIYSHIDNGQDFYNYEPKEHYDFIFSNPPFSGKKDLIKRLLELKKPFALIFGIQCFSSGSFIKEVKKLENLKIILLTKRMKFFKKIDGKEPDPKKLPQPTFHSIGLCDGEKLDKINIWE